MRHSWIALSRPVSSSSVAQKGDGTRILLVVEAADQHEIEMRLGEDPWAPMGLLRIGEIQPWTIWLDGRQPDLKH